MLGGNVLVMFLKPVMLDSRSLPATPTGGSALYIDGQLVARPSVGQGYCPPQFTNYGIQSQ